MRTDRVEAFSDGVFAVAITLLVPSRAQRLRVNAGSVLHALYYVLDWFTLRTVA